MLRDTYHHVMAYILNKKFCFTFDLFAFRPVPSCRTCVFGSVDGKWACVTNQDVVSTMGFEALDIRRGWLTFEKT